ncbi:MAG: AmmeMemoRadiSam system protein A [Bdellovibrionota bacterium]
MQALDFLTPKLNDEEKNFLIKLSYQTLENFVLNTNKPKVNEAKLSKNLLKNTASFITLKKNKDLRGCIGSVVAHRPLYIDVIENTIFAASKDTRFEKISKLELSSISISISVLSDLHEIKYNSIEELYTLIEPFKDGLVIKNGALQGLFLPSVWEELPSKELFLSNLCLKAGFAPNKWHQEIVVYKFRSLSFS